MTEAELLAAPKGVYRGGKCNRTACQELGAVYYNNGTDAWYCTRCARLINESNPACCLYSTDSKATKAQFDTIWLSRHTSKEEMYKKLRELERQNWLEHREVLMRERDSLTKSE